MLHLLMEVISGVKNYLADHRILFRLKFDNVLLAYNIRLTMCGDVGTENAFRQKH